MDLILTTDEADRLVGWNLGVSHNRDLLHIDVSLWQIFVLKVIAM